MNTTRRRMSFRSCKASSNRSFPSSFPGEHWVDVMKPGVTKGGAMRGVQKKLGITPEECMAFGDYLNDCELLQSVGESYAMENAHPRLKEMARHIAPSNDEDGVMRVIRREFGLTGGRRAMTNRKTWARDALISLLLAAGYMLIFAYNNTPLGAVIGSDNAMYLTMGTALAKGYAPYTEIFDHKGPLLFLLQLLPQAVSGGYSLTAVFIQETLVLFACLMMMRAIAKELDVCPWAAQLCLWR